MRSEGRRAGLRVRAREDVGRVYPLGSIMVYILSVALTLTLTLTLALALALALTLRYLCLNPYPRV